MASICGWMRCILRALCMDFTRKGSISKLMKTVRTMIAQPQEPLQLKVMWAWIACSDRKRYLAMGPQKPNSSIGSSEMRGSVAWTLLRTLMALGPTKMLVSTGPPVLPSAAPRTGRMMGLVAGESEPKPVRLMNFETSRSLRSVVTVAVSGESGIKTAAKKRSATPAKSNGPERELPAEIFFASVLLKLPLRY